MSTSTQLTTATIELTQTEQTFKENVEAAMNRLPRFLFRMYHATSGGYASLNTPTAITPLAFSVHNKAPHPSSFYKLKPSNIASIADMHMRGGSSKRTIFSSWSQSLSTVIGMGGHDPNRHLCIWDTAQLDDSVIVLHTEQLPSLLGRPGLISYPYELLAYGVVRGPAFQAVPASKLRAITVNFNAVSLSSSSLAFNFSLLTDIYASDLQLAMAAHCFALSSTSVKEREARDRLILKLSELPIPADWQHDPKIMNLEESIFRRGGDCAETIEAAKLMRDVVRLSLTMRPSRELRRLEIDAIGWAASSTRLRSGRSRGE